VDQFEVGTAHVGARSGWLQRPCQGRRAEGVCHPPTPPSAPRRSDASVLHVGARQPERCVAREATRT